jgi:hypothetical protein
LPRTDWRYCVLKYAEPMVANMASRFSETAGVKPRPRKSEGGIIGDSILRWRWTKSAAKSRPTVTDMT